MAEEGMRLTRVIGPQTPHRYHPDSKVEIDRMLDAIVARGRDPWPRKVRFTTWTLAYNRMNWVTIDAMGKHWERARLNAEITGDSAVAVETSNVTAFSLEMGPGGCPLDPATQPVVTIDGQKVRAPAPDVRPFVDRAFQAERHAVGSGRDGRGSSGKAARIAGPDRRCVPRSLRVGHADRHADRARASRDGSRPSRSTRSRNGAATSAAKRRCATTRT